MVTRSYRCRPAIRRKLPTYQIGLDLSPLLVILGLEIVDRFLLPSIAAALLY